MFGFFRDWRERRKILSDTKQVAREREREIELSPHNPIKLAEIALRFGDQAEAQRHWTVAKTQYPGLIDRARRQSLSIMIGLQLLDEAETYLSAGQIRFPGDPFYHEGLAQVAQRRGNLDEAIKQWAEARKRNTNDTRYYYEAVSCLARAGRLAEAEALAVSAIELFPNDKDVRTEYAIISEARQDWPESLRRWNLVTEKVRGETGLLGTAKALQKLGRFDEADRVLFEARSQAPTKSSVAMLWAENAYLNGNKEEAASRWDLIREKFPQTHRAYNELAAILVELGRSDEAERVRASKP